MIEYEILIDVNELRKHLGEANWCIVDCRFSLLDPQQGYAQYRAGHIPTAHYANLDKDLAAPVTPMSGRHPLPDARKFAARLGQFGISNDTQVVVYDEAGGAIAARLWWLLNWLGHRRVALLDGGYNAWLQTEPGSTAIPQQHDATFVGHPNYDMVVSTRELSALLADADDATLLVDARDRARFAGDLEPIDAVAGHVPGALNFPFVDSLNSDGTWRDAATLATRWGSILGPGKDSSWIAMCGSGVTACHLAISAQLAGFSTPTLYAGSWSEWIRDPARPIAAGTQ